MPIEIVESKAIPPGEIAQFEFQHTVIDCAFGIRLFRLSYGTEHHWARRISISVRRAASSAADTNLVSAFVTIDMEDDSGHQAAHDDSYVIPVCVAVTKNLDNNTIIGPANGIAKSQRVTYPKVQSKYHPETCFQSGFDLSFDSADHQLWQAHASCTIAHDANDGTGEISAPSGLEDQSGNIAQTATVDAGYIVSASGDPGMDSGMTQNQSMIDSKTVKMSGLTSISSAAVLIARWRINCPTAKDINWIQVGAEGNIGIQGNVVTIPKLYAVMQDGNGYQQDNLKSYCAVQVVAIP